MKVYTVPTYYCASCNEPLMVDIEQGILKFCHYMFTDVDCLQKDHNFTINIASLVESK